MHRAGKYLIGAALIYGICVLLGGESLATEFGTVFSLGLVMGVFFFILLGPVHFLLQALGHFIITRIKPSISNPAETCLLNLPVLIGFIYLLVQAALPPSPTLMRALFQQHLEHPLPATATVKGYWMLRGMNEGKFAFWFGISTNDFADLVKTEGFGVQDIASQEASTKQANAEHYQEMARKLSPHPPSFAIPVTVYTNTIDKKITRFQKTMIVGTNATEVLFLESFH
ncbi:MAG TPA: hypothetical protein VL527_01305 [Dongiaceae bacterium]|nr:hypothetical protein [Dongiaceae bacterium]